MPESTKTVQDEYLLDKAMGALKNRVAGWEMSFSIAQCVGLEAG